MSVCCRKPDKLEASGTEESFTRSLGLPGIGMGISEDCFWVRSRRMACYSSPTELGEDEAMCGASALTLL